MVICCGCLAGVWLISLLFRAADGFALTLLLVVVYVAGYYLWLFGRIC